MRKVRRILWEPILSVRQGRIAMGGFGLLLKEVEYTEHPIRLIGLSVSNPVKEEPHTKDRWEQLSFEFSDWK